MTDPEEALRALVAEQAIVILSCGDEIATLRVQLAEALDVIEAFIAETVDYMTINKLGDPEKQHNVKWGRAVIARIDALREAGR